MPTTSPPEDDLHADYVNESHIQAFAHALEAEEEEVLVETSGTASPVIGTAPRPQRVRKVSALSDFAPISQRVKRPRFGQRPRKRRDWLFHMIRWPLLGLLFMVIFGQFGLYVFIRQVVNALEWLLVWRGRKKALRRQLRGAQTWQEWKDAALTMDQYMKFDAWKREDQDPYFDWLLVRKVLRSLKSLKNKDDVRGVLGVLEVCIRENFAGAESTRLYSETYYGTKNLIESYVTEVESALAYIRKSSKLSIEEKRRFFRSANRNLGSSALCLSGGATFGYYHFGVVKAFLDANLLPRVITGTSSGSLVAALVCTRTDAELRRLLVPALADRITACEEPLRVWLERFWMTGARFDAVKWARKASFFTRGSLTFREAYELTGRVLNVSVIPSDRHSPTKLLNYLTAPDCIIWSALIASAAVPGILNPVVLMQKTKAGNIIPWNWGTRFKDGSLRVDVPVQSLNLLFNVNHPIVSQVNPHVHLFFFASRGSAGKPVAHTKGKGWRGGFLLSAAEQFLKHELTKNFKVIRDLELMPELLGTDWSSVFLQRFDGVVTIWPRTRVWDWIRILSDPDRQELQRMIRVGEMAAWPKLHMIDNRIRLEREIIKGRQAVRIALRARDKELPTAVPEITGDGAPTEPPAATTSTSPPPRRLGIEVPLTSLASEQLPIESDAEHGFATGAQRFFKKVKGQLSLDMPRASSSRSGESGTGTPKDIEHSPVEDPLASPVRRRRWASTLLNRGEDDGYFAGVRTLPVAGSQQGRARGKLPDMHRPPSPQAQRRTASGSAQASPVATRPGSPAHPTHERSSSFFERIRSNSFASFPHFGMGSRQTGAGAANGGGDAETRSIRSEKDRESILLPDEHWSSDSDSEDELGWNAGRNSRFSLASSSSRIVNRGEMAGDSIDLASDGLGQDT